MKLLSKKHYYLSTRICERFFRSTETAMVDKTPTLFWGLNEIQTFPLTSFDSFAAFNKIDHKWFNNLSNVGKNAETPTLVHSDLKDRTQNVMIDSIFYWQESGHYEEQILRPHLCVQYLLFLHSFLNDCTLVYHENANHISTFMRFDWHTALVRNFSYWKTSAKDIFFVVFLHIKNN